MPKTHKAYSEYIKNTVKKWIPRLNLQHYRLGVQRDDTQAFMASRYRYPYLEGQILWTQKSYEAWLKDSNQEHEIVHELCHLITDPFYTRAVERYITKDALEDERERLTDQIAVIVKGYYD